MLNTLGVFYDDKENVTQHGGQLTLFGVAIPNKPRDQDDQTFEGMRLQHTCGLTHMCLNNSGSASYYTALMRCIANDMKCSDETCQHRRIYRDFGGAGGFKLERECRQQMTWSAETSDMCTASFSSFFQRRRSQHEFQNLTALYACYAHDDRAHLKTMSKLLGSATATVLDRGMRGFRWLFYCYADTLAQRFEVYFVCRSTKLHGMTWYQIW